MLTENGSANRPKKLIIFLAVLKPVLNSFIEMKSMAAFLWLFTGLFSQCIKMQKLICCSLSWHCTTVQCALVSAQMGLIAQG